MERMDEIIRLIEDQRVFFGSGRTREVAFRKAELRRLLDMVKTNGRLIVEALYADMRKPALEVYASEIGTVKNEIKYALDHLTCWTRPRRVHTPKHLLPSRSFIVPEPRGLALIIAPWNYPFTLSLSPIVNAMAAGNCAILKPSEFAPHTANLISELISRNFDPKYISVVTGAAEEARMLLDQKFDYILYTGSTAIGRLVMEAAARHLTPVTLELGGKSPCIVDAEIDIPVAARRIVWAKFFNAGQTCIAPDYLLVDRAIKPPFLKALIHWTGKFFGPDPFRSPDYARIVNERHFQRLERLLGQGDIIAGGHTDAVQRYIAPTIIADILPGHAIMQEEIFGPILPVLDYDDLDQAITFVNERPKPLALYFFSHDRAKQRRVLTRTSSGGVCINDALVHFASHTLPFGGVGDSGMGSYHGKAGFDTFTHYKPVVKNTLKLDPTLRYEPYRLKLPLVRRFF
ncbi:MAG: aldehyde dehydrogenase [Syntrophaceae bacterium]